VLDGKSGDFRLLVSGLELWQRDPPLWRAVWARGRTFTLQIPMSSLAAFHPLEILYFWIAAHLPLTGEAVKRTAQGS
jgi:hypothetical protein